MRAATHLPPPRVQFRTRRLSLRLKAHLVGARPRARAKHRDRSSQALRVALGEMGCVCRWRERAEVHGACQPLCSYNTGEGAHNTIKDYGRIEKVYGSHHTLNSAAPAHVANMRAGKVWSENLPPVRSRRAQPACMQGCRRAASAAIARVH